jgi:hypothetical protein
MKIKKTKNAGQFFMQFMLTSTLRYVCGALCRTKLTNNSH